MRKASHPRHPLATDVAREHRTEPLPPVANGFVADIDAPSAEQVFDVPQLSENRTYIITTGRITSGDELK
jgi:hypothetical protein